MSAKPEGPACAWYTWVHALHDRSRQTHPMAGAAALQFSALCGNLGPTYIHTYIHTYMHPHILTYAFSLRLLILLSMTPRWHRVSWQLVVRGHRAFDSTDFIQRSGTRGARKPWSPE